MLNLNIQLMDGNIKNIQIKNKNIFINDLIDIIYNKYLKNQYKQKDNYIFLLNYNNNALSNKLSDYNISNNSNIKLIIKTKSKNIEQNKSIIDDYIISPFSSSLSNSYEKEISKIDISYIMNKIKIIEESVSDIKEYISN